MKRATITQVAVQAGVSPSTASKALSGTDCISPATVERVIRAAKELGYRPNRAAQMLASKNKKIGVLLPAAPSEVYSLHEKGISAALAEYAPFGFTAEIRRFDRERDEVEFPRLLDELAGEVNGLIFLYEYRVASYREALRSLTIPAVSLQGELDGFPSVTADARTVGRMAAEFLSLCGCGGTFAESGAHTVNSVAAVVTGDRNAPIHRDNLEGFREYAVSHGMEIARVADTNDEFGETYAVTERMLCELPALTGIFVSTYTSLAVCECLKAHGLAGKVKVIGVDVYDRSAACLKDGSLSAAIYQNQVGQAQTAFRKLVSLMHDPSSAENVKIKPELVLSSALPYYANSLL